eukprot:6857748-Pyramimonas_sp.AAC.1
MAVSQISANSLDHSPVIVDRILAHFSGIVGIMPKILSPPAGLGAIAPTVAHSCCGHGPLCSTAL